jgi:hypothetical protein
MPPQVFKNGARAVDGHDSPRQRQYITPVTVGMKQSLEQGIVAFAQGSLELSKPTLGDGQIGFSSGKHGMHSCFCQATSLSPVEKVALPPIADIDRASRDVRFVPKADMLYSITLSALMARVCAK